MERELKSYTSWFIFIGILSIINSVFWWFEIAEVYFLVGLGMTQFVDANLYLNSGDSGLAVALIINALISGFFILTAILTNRGFKTIFYVATAIYILDAIIVIYYRDYLSFGFHILALYFIFKGIKYLKDQDKKTNDIEETEIE